MRRLNIEAPFSSFIKIIITSLFFFLCTSGVIAQNNWWNPNWNYRIPLTVELPAEEHREKPISFTINFTVALRAANVRNQFDYNTIRLVEVNPSGQMIDEDLRCKFDWDLDYNPALKAQGKVSFILKESNRPTRYFALYFDSKLTSNSMLYTETRYSGKKGSEADSIWNEDDYYRDRTIITLGRVETRPGAIDSKKIEVPIRRIEMNVAISEPRYLNKPEHKFFGGYCTWYAAKKWKEYTGMPVTWSGDGGRWFDNASEEGRKVSTEPLDAVRGAIIVWTRARSAGHVAFVEDVDEEGIYISEMNARGLWVVSDAYLPFTNLDKGTKYKFKGYILP